MGSRAASLVDVAAPAFVIFGAAAVNARDRTGATARAEAESLLKRILVIGFGFECESDVDFFDVKIYEHILCIKVLPSFNRFREP